MAKDVWWKEVSFVALREAIMVAGNQTKLARALVGKHPSVNQQKVNFWLARGYCAADDGICISIEQETGVSRHRLRPDVYPIEAPSQEPQLSQGILA